MDDRSLLISLKKGDRDAFDAIFRKYVAKVYHVAAQFFGNGDDVEEVVQETFIKVWENRGKIDEEQNFNAYLLSIAKNHIYNTFRHRSVERKYLQRLLETSPDRYSIEGELSDRHLREFLLSRIAMLSPKQREILLLKEQGLYNDEIAQKLNISKRTIEWHINEAYHRLRLLLGGSVNMFIAALFVI